MIAVVLGVSINIIANKFIRFRYGCGCGCCCCCGWEAWGLVFCCRIWASVEVGCFLVKNIYIYSMHM